MVQSLQESDLLQHLLPAQQLLVYIFGRNCALAPSLVAPLGHREATPEEQRRPSSEGARAAVAWLRNMRDIRQIWGVLKQSLPS